MVKTGLKLLSLFLSAIVNLFFKINFWVVNKVSYVLLYQRKSKRGKAIIERKEFFYSKFWRYAKILLGLSFYLFAFYCFVYRFYFLPSVVVDYSSIYSAENGRHLDLFHIVCEAYVVGWEMESVKGNFFYKDPQQEEELQNLLAPFAIGHNKLLNPERKFTPLKFFFLSNMYLFSTTFAPLEFLSMHDCVSTDSSLVLQALYTIYLQSYTTLFYFNDLIFFKTVYYNYLNYAFHFLFHRVPAYFQRFPMALRSLDTEILDIKLDWIIKHPWEYFSLEKQLGPLVLGDLYYSIMDPAHYVRIREEDDAYYVRLGTPRRYRRRILPARLDRALEEIGLLEICFSGYLFNKKTFLMLMRYVAPPRLYHYPGVERIASTNEILEGVWRVSWFLLFSAASHISEGGSGIFFLVSQCFNFFYTENCGPALSYFLFGLTFLFFLILGYLHVLSEIFMCVLYLPFHSATLYLYCIFYSFSPGILLSTVPVILSYLRDLLLFYLVNLSCVVFFLWLIFVRFRFAHGLAIYVGYVWGTFIILTNDLIKGWHAKRMVRSAYRGPNVTREAMRDFKFLRFVGPTLAVGLFSLHMLLYFLLLPFLPSILNVLADVCYLIVRPLGWELGPFFLKSALENKMLDPARESLFSEGTGVIFDSFRSATNYSTQRTERKVLTLMAEGKSNKAIQDINFSLSGGKVPEEFEEIYEKYLDSRHGQLRRQRVQTRATHCDEYLVPEVLDRRYLRFKIVVVGLGDWRRFEDVNGPKIIYGEHLKRTLKKRRKAAFRRMDQLVAYHPERSISSYDEYLRTWWEIEPGTKLAQMPRRFRVHYFFDQLSERYLQFLRNSLHIRERYDPSTHSTLLRRKSKKYHFDYEGILGRKSWGSEMAHMVWLFGRDYGDGRYTWDFRSPYAWANSYRRTFVEDWDALDPIMLPRTDTEFTANYDPWYFHEVTSALLPEFLEGEFFHPSEDAQDEKMDIIEYFCDDELQPEDEMSVMPLIDPDVERYYEARYLKWRRVIFFYWCYIPLALYFYANLRTISFRNFKILRRALWAPIFVFGIIELEPYAISEDTWFPEWAWHLWEVSTKSSYDPRLWYSTVADVPCLDYYICTDLKEYNSLTEDLTKLTSVNPEFFEKMTPEQMRAVAAEKHARETEEAFKRAYERYQYWRNVGKTIYSYLPSLPSSYTTFNLDEAKPGIGGSYAGKFYKTELGKKIIEKFVK